MKMMRRTLCVLTAMILLICGCCSAASAAKKVAVKNVKLNKIKCSVNVGASVKLTATISPSNATDKKITWSSSDTKVAKVNKKGVVEGVSPGTAIITAKAGNGKAASCKVNVKEIKVKSLSFASSSIDLIGKTQLSVSIKPTSATNRKITWSSSDTKVAKVDSKGVVTPTGYGTATITARSSNGKKASCKVNVKKDVTIKKSHIVVDDIIKMVDTMIIVADGKTGKIISTDCYQTKTDGSFIVGMTVAKNGIKAYNVQDDYVDFRATWGSTFSLEIPGLKAKVGEALNNTNRYRLHNNGKLEVLDSSCSSWFGICKRLNKEGF